MLSLILAALVWSNQVEVWYVALGAFLNGVFWTIDARRTLLGEAAGHEQVGVAMSLDRLPATELACWGSPSAASSWPRPDCLGFIYYAALYVVGVGIFVVTSPNAKVGTVRARTGIG